MDRRSDTVPRRTVLRLGSAAAIGTYTLPVAAAEEGPVDDEGNPIDADGNEDVFSTSSSLPVNPDDSRDGSIASSEYTWLETGSGLTDGDRALRIADDGGVEPNFRPRTDDDLTIVFDWRHAEGGSLAYAFNDLDSTSRGFRVFTNSLAGDGLYFRNPFGGSDLVFRGDVQDGAWHRVRVVLDARENQYRAYVDGALVGSSYYHGSGWTARDRFRVMGRASGSSTSVDYDRYLVVPEVLEPGESASVEPLISYALDEGEGDVVRNGIGLDRGTVEEKVELIERIRTEAGTLMSESAASRLDERAEVLLEDVETELERGEAPVEREALDRMVMSEEITVAGTKAGIGPATGTGDAAAELALIIATGGVGKRLLDTSTAVGRFLAGRIGAIRRSARTSFDELIGRPLLPRRTRREIDERIERATDDVQRLIEGNADELESIGETATKDSLSAAYERLPEEILSAFRSLRDSFSRFLARTFYTAYQTQSERTDDGRRLQPPGLDTATEDRMVTVERFIEDDSLQEDGREDRRALCDTAVVELTAIGEAAESVLEKGRELSDGISSFSGLVLFGALIAYAIAIAASVTGVGVGIGVGAAVLGSKFVAVSGLVGSLATIVTGGSVPAGRSSLNMMAKIHERSTKGVVTGGDLR